MTVLVAHQRHLKVLQGNASQLIIAHLAHPLGRGQGGDNSLLPQAICAVYSVSKETNEKTRVTGQHTQGSIPEFEDGKRTLQGILVNIVWMRFGKYDFGRFVNKTNSKGGK